ncbi:MAG: imidazole glycerol phosphate synthase subunit HisF [Acidimicrobiia bacterium]|nr:imidazole glycerol phosphate synthase subunit HisF [Acidimicrobiia bacterium]
MKVAIADSGVANLASIRSAFRALGLESTVTGDGAVFEAAEFGVVPGVGSFGAGMAALRRAGLDEAITRRAAAGRPLLAVCLGMQMLGAGSEESPGVGGLSVIDGTFERLPEGVRAPHLGWNRVTTDGTGALLTSGDAAFANTFCLTSVPDGWSGAWTDYGRPFVSAIERGRLLATQFHPELSGEYGLALLRRWIEGRPAAAGPISPGRHSHRIIPCLDVKAGRVVKGVQFTELRDAGDPAERAALYEAQGADEIVLLDVAASPEEAQTRVETVRRVRERIHIPLTVGGGVRSIEDAERLLGAGADRVSVNTAAVNRPALIDELADRFGSQCIVLAIDARAAGEGWEVLTVGGREPSGLSAVEWAAEGARRGAGEILLTSWDRDGTGDGYDLALLAAIARAVPVPVIASGGAGVIADMADAIGAGADAVLAASVFHDDLKTVLDAKQELAELGMAVRA